MSFEVRFTLTGEMPLLMHADDVEAADTLDVWRKDPANKNVSKAGDDRSPAWTWMSYLYSDGTHVTVPSHNLMVNLRYAGTQIIMKKQKTFKETSQSGMLIPDEYLDFQVGNGRKVAMADILAMKGKLFAEQATGAEALGFRLYVKRARVGQSKHVRVRPRFDTWSVSGRVIVTAPELTFDVLKQMFEIGGRGGMCDWRPNCKTPGPYGMYSAEVKKNGKG